MCNLGSRLLLVVKHDCLLFISCRGVHVPWRSAVTDSGAGMQDI